MNLLRHHLKKDARHLRWLLGLWVLIVLAEGLLVGFGRYGDIDDMAALMAYQVIRMLLPLLQLLLIVVIVPLLIHDEPQVGTTAFWFTRPIPRRLLLASKAMFIGGVLILFPVVTELGVMAANRVPPGELAAVTPELFYDAARLVAPIAALAVLTVNFARFAIAGVAVYVAFMILYVALYIASLFSEGPAAWVSRSASLELSRGLVGGLVLIVAGLAVVLNQYLRRRTATSVCLAVAGLLVMTAVGRWWPVNFMRLPDARLEPATLEGPPLSVKIESQKGSDAVDFGFGARRPAHRNQKAVVTVTGLTPVRDTRVAVIRGRFTLDDGRSVASTNRIVNEPTLSRDLSADTLQALFPESRIIAPEPTRTVSLVDVLSIPLSEWFAFRGRQGRLEGEADVVVETWQIDAEFEPSRGRRYRHGATEEMLGRFEIVGNRVIGRVRRVEMSRRYRRQHDDATALNFWRSPDTAYVLHHPVRGELLAPQRTADVGLTIGGGRRLNITPIELAFPAANIGSQAVPVLDHDWFEGARLVRISRVREGIVTVPFEVETFTLTERDRESDDD